MIIKSIKQSIFVFWALWFSVVFLTNFSDALKALYLLPNTWLFSSGNWPFMKQVTAVYHTSLWMQAIIFSLILIGKIVVIFAFLKAFCSVLHKKSHVNNSVNIAFAIGLGFWAMFLIGDEIFVAYTIETNHQNLTNLMLLSALFYYCIPNQNESKS